jgi:hypothetical protein
MKDCHTRARAAAAAAGRAVAVAVAVRGSWLVVDRTLVRIFLSNGYAFCLE